jgi:DNA-binding transcriptional LysR family regulator
MIDWDDIRFFLAVARKGSITAAARDLGVNHSTVSRRIAAFEGSMGTRLFDRVSSGYTLTPSGQDMVPSAQRMEEEALSLDRQLFGRDEELNGTLKVSIAGPFAGLFFMDQIRQFLEKYPAIDVNLDVSNGLANLHAREVDVALRATDDPPDTLVGRRIGRLAASLYGRKDMIAPGELGAKAEAQAPLIIKYSNSTRDWQEQGWFRDVYPHAKQRMETQSPETILKALKVGMGIGVLPCFMGDMEPDLRRLPPYHLESMYDLWILTHADLRKTARVRAFINFLADAMAPHRDLIEGRQPPQFTSGESVQSSAYEAAE